MEYLEFLKDMDEINQEIIAQPPIDSSTMTPEEMDHAIKCLRELEKRQYQLLIDYGYLREHEMICRI